jgi:RNA polymerase sigma-70 factor (ECF subfamily)
MGEVAWSKVRRVVRPIQKAKQMSVHVRSYFSEALLKELPHLRAYARLMMNDLYKADHEVEKTLKRAMCSMDRMSGRSDLRVQLLTILRSFLIGGEHRLRKHFTASPAIYERLNSPFRIGNRHSESALSLASALVCLNFEDREAVVLSAGVRLSPREAAKMCGCEVSVYDARLCRGFARLAELVLEKWDGASAGEAIVSQASAAMKGAGKVQEARALSRH